MNIDLHMLARVPAVLCIALLAGIYLGDAIGVRHARDQINPAGFVQMQQAIHVRFMRLMPPLILGTLVGHLWWLCTLRAGSLPFWVVLISLLGVMALALMTRIVSAPINRQLMRWSASAPPADVRALWLPWEKVNRWRLLIALIVLAAELSLLAWQG